MQPDVVVPPPDVSTPPTLSPAETQSTPPPSQSTHSKQLPLLVIAVIFILIIGAAAYVVMRTNKNSDSNKSSQSKNSSAVWKTYSWTAEGLSFKYPASWSLQNPQLTPSEEKTQPVLTPSEPVVYLFSPKIVTATGFNSGSTPDASDMFKGDFAINATKDSAANIEAGTDAGSPHGIPPFVYVLKVIPFTVPGYKQMWIIEEGEQSKSYADELAITDIPVKVGLTNSSDDDSFQSKTTPGDRISFTIGLFSQAVDLRGNFGFINMQVKTFEQQQDYNNALKILKSISYSG